ncbi:PTS system cellobiose-specific IIC component [Breznakia sp. PF5-3]|uniref:PTS sugar transporter subunit IIC n=1 Tax=unclassified Breznakia TaxID=2623764 RepID=UPI0024076B3B|nr:MULTISPECIES: PTS transporter subunit EIIC [unclassified Breznakia]MDF9824524.1 PTS system cellobiose-specific IIC component [Breznakia sp. PM6-1]MDF9835310.1 PTS system cellobiose-specific IIC component [Breznakia sp. PF5-3]MDF9837026.1 PTS system cellobiose-specific IIC component [Breznakia sp. PFB2-8]MDF9858951.1 PTS system cellobiose-specific IIC component [Breznakia sp. PH5-24]
MEKLTNFIEKHIAPVANKLARNKYVQAIQSAFLTLIPFMTIGSFALIIISPPVDFTTMDAGILRSFMEGWQNVANFCDPALSAVFMGTIGSISLFTALGLAYNLSKQYKMDSFLPTILAGGTFIIVNAIDRDWAFNATYFEGVGLFGAIVISALTVEMYRFLTNKKIGAIELTGNGVPPALTESFKSLVPAAIITVFMGTLSALVIHFTGDMFPALIGKMMGPIVGLVDNVWGVMILALIVMVFWWFGIHDTVITGPLSPLLYSNLTANMTAYAAGTAAVALPFVLTEPFWFTFMAIGGSGATFGLAILCFRSKSKQIRTVGKLAIVPAFFNINEPLIFGLPLMFNPTMFVPFALVMPLNGVITYILMNLGIVGSTFANPSWNMFSPIGALISTLDIKAVILVLALIVIDMLIYLPFFKVYEKQKIAEEKLNSGKEA